MFSNLAFALLNKAFILFLSILMASFDAIIVFLNSFMCKYEFDKLRNKGNKFLLMSSYSSLLKLDIVLIYVRSSSLIPIHIYLYKPSFFQFSLLLYI